MFKQPYILGHVRISEISETPERPRPPCAAAPALFSDTTIILPPGSRRALSCVPRLFKTLLCFLAFVCFVLVVAVAPRSGRLPFFLFCRAVRWSRHVPPAPPALRAFFKFYFLRSRVRGRTATWMYYYLLATALINTEAGAPLARNLKQAAQAAKDKKQQAKLMILET